ncbi:hypothetical protein LTR09_005614 [Extremus antarcticus]|uniref:Uncharacterized protein n=1 Tax=Extremus antarcticus TaxID=702011 RepID=A0AAJ0G8M1_9PEZI|nr:hypothetical protein LTR09_005614 [Extremus antarcticus]
MNAFTKATDAELRNYTSEEVSLGLGIPLAILMFALLLYHCFSFGPRRAEPDVEMSVIAPNNVTRPVGENHEATMTPEVEAAPVEDVPIEDVPVEAVPVEAGALAITRASTESSQVDLPREAVAWWRIHG